jgi:hypothetical protein
MLVPAYAATIHKSQGSEYPAVIIPVLTQHYPMLQLHRYHTRQAAGCAGWAEEGRRHRGTKRLWPAEVVEAGRVAVPWSIHLAANWVHKLSHGG